MDSGDVRPYLALFTIAALAGLAVTVTVPLSVWALAGIALAAATALSKYRTQATGRRARILATLAVVCMIAAPGVVMAAHIAGTVPIQNGVPLSSTDNTTVVVQGSTDAFLEDFTILSGTVDVITEDGNMTVFSSGDTHVAVQESDIEGTTTNLTAIDTSQNTIQADPADKSQVTLGGAINTFDWGGDYAVDDGNWDFAYSANGQARVTIEGDAADGTLLVARDVATDTILDNANAGSGGAVTFNQLDSGTHDSVQVQTFDPARPTQSDPSPTGDQSTEPSDLSIQINDSDFSQGDDVTVTFDLDGSQIDQQTISSNQTVTTSIPSSGLTGGEHTWTVNATDSFGEENIESYSYSVPDTLFIRHERNHTDLVDSPVSVNGTFFGGDQIFDRGPVTDGTIDMTGLPVTETFIVSVNASDGNYTRRTAFIPTIFQQQSAYLLNTSEVNTIESRFILSDPTGQYGPSSVLLIQRPINTSTETVWRTIHGDEFGVEGVTATLQEGQRYRIRVRNQQGDTQIVGPYRADVGETVTVEPGTPQIELSDFTDGFAADAELRNDTLEWAYSDPENLTDELTVYIHEQGNASNELVTNQTFFNLGNASAQHTLTENETELTWVVEFIVDRDGEEFTTTRTLSNTKSLFGDIDPNLRLAGGIVILFMFAGAFSVLNAAIGAVIVALLGGLLWYIGMLPGATSAIAVVLALFLAVLNYLRKGG